MERGAPGNRHSAPRPRMWRPNLFAGHGTPLDGRRALFTLVITPRPVPLRWLASHKLSSAMLSLFRRRRRQPNRLGSLNAFYETASLFPSPSYFLPSCFSLIVDKPVPQGHRLPTSTVARKLLVVWIRKFGRSEERLKIRWRVNGVCSLMLRNQVE